MVALPFREQIQDALALPPRRWFVESVPVAGILLFWNLLASVVYFPYVSESIGSAGVVMAALYVVVRGVALSSEVLPPMTGGVTGILYENASIAVPAGAWFLAAMAVSMVEESAYDVLSAFKVTFAGAGLGVVALYAVAAGCRALDGGNAVGGRPRTETGTDGASADD